MGTTRRRHARTALAVALVGLLAPLPSTAAGAGFTPPPFHVGEQAHYQLVAATTTLTVLPPEPTLDQAGRSVDAFGIRDEYASGTVARTRVERVLARTMTVEVLAQPCAIRTNGACGPWERRDWAAVQGTGGAFESTLLQGRAFSIGDSWLVPGACAPCAGPTRVDIEPPAATSPAGTAYVARITHDHLVPRGDTLLHMGTTHAFPLRAVRVGVSNALLVAHGAGGDAIVPPSPPEAAAYPAPLTSQPFESGRPVEGAPVPAARAWSEARNATAPDARDLDPSATFLSVRYRRQVEQVPVPPGGIVTREEHQVTSTYARPGTTDAVATYRLSRVAPGTPAEGVLGGWSVENATRSASALGACASHAAPFWDGIRFALGTGLVPDAAAYDLLSSPPCQTYRASVLGQSDGSDREFVEVNLHTGLLEAAVLLRP